MSDDFGELVKLLDLDQVGEGVFRGTHPPGRTNRMFGGQLLAQALVAANRTIPPGRRLASLHAYFLRAGIPGVALEYRVEVVRDGRSFSSRRVAAYQQGKEAFSLSASYQTPEPGLDHGIRYDVSGLPEPESCIAYGDWMLTESDERDADWARSIRPVDNRYINPPPSTRGVAVGEPQLFWLRARGELGEDPNLHAAVVAYGSDESISDIVLLPHGRRWIDSGVDTASLDHAMWFHRPVRADEWLLFVQETVSTAGARGLARGEIYTADGLHVSSVVQDSLLRVADDDGGAS